MNTSTVKRCSAAAVLGLAVLLPDYSTLHTSGAGLALITDFEGCRLSPYQCSAGVWTNGIGHTRDVAANTTLTEAQAAENLIADVKHVERGLARCMPGPMPQPVYDAVAAFAFNVGVSAACGSTLATHINKQQWRAACDQLPRWVYVDGVRSNGLARRRAAEQALCLSGA
ncbi:lysozyme [Nissabacter archeti]|uniref:lysozyme n=1 Tax=Nissabacter archeti TaxID=1917880 RepID=UPI0009320EE9|nr:lysozyme [Nissabacter archeti]